MVELRRGVVIEPEEYTLNKYKIVVYFMFGDADGEDEYVDYCEEEEAIKLVDLLVNQETGRDPGEVDEYIEWPQDPMCNWDVPASYQGFSITYIDAINREHTVHVFDEKGSKIQ